MAIVLFCRGKDGHYSHEFILIAAQLILCNFMALLPQVFLILPEILQTKNNSYENKKAWIGMVFSNCRSFSFFVILHFSLLLAVNRFVALILPKFNTIFESRRLYILSAFMWLILLATQVADFYFCIRSFHIWNISWIKDCTKSSLAKLWMRMRDIWKLTIPNIMFLMHIAIFYGIRRKRRRIMGAVKTNDVNISEYEWSTLIQASWYCGAWEIEIIIAKFLPSILIMLFGKDIDIPLKIFINCYAISICALLPTIHFIYSKESRNIIKNHLYHWLKLKLDN